MTRVLDEQGRPAPPPAGSEAATLRGFLDHQRATFAWKTRGLTDDQLRVALPPSPMTLGGMMKHLAAVEDSWFTVVVGHSPMPEPWGCAMQGDSDWPWRSAMDEPGDRLRNLWAERVRRSRVVVDAALVDGEGHGLAQLHSARGGHPSVSLRWVLLHMIEEYARHNGHADLLRESIDGETGE
jgi:uncharacterized damage-inducible protein DinB